MRNTDGNPTRVRRALASPLPPFLALAACLVVFQPLELSAGLFSKMKERKAAARAAKAAVSPPAPTAPAPPRPRFSPFLPSPPRAPRQDRLGSAPPTTTSAPAPELTRATPVAPRPAARIRRRGEQRPRVFVLGDSQSLLSFGTEFQKTLVEAGCEVHFHAVKNGTPYYWQGRWPSPVLTRVFEAASAPEECGRWEEVSMRPLSISEYVERHDPDVFIFQAGTNFETDLGPGGPAGIVKLLDQSLRDATARGARVLWVGPPDARDDIRPPEFQDQAVANLRAALSPWSQVQGIESFFDSRPACPMPNDTLGDGEHPSHSAGIAWANAAGAWAAEGISHWARSGLLRDAAPREETSGAAPLGTFTRQDAAPDPSDTFVARVQLLAKSDSGDVSTLPYTDAFSVFRYRVLNADEIGSRLGATPRSESGDPIIQVLHWSAHNDGSGPRPTRVAQREPGETTTMELCLLSAHPLADALGTMTRFDDFGDLRSPLFVSADLLGERRR